MKKRGVYLAYIFALLNSLIVGFSFLFTKTAISASSPLDTLAFRFTIAFAVLLILVLLKIIKLDLSPKKLQKLLPLTIFYPAMFFSFQAFGLKYAQSSDAGIIFASTPIITTMLAGYFLKEKTNLLQNLSILLSVFGVVFIFMMKGSSLDVSNLLGIALLLVSCISIAGYSVMGRSLSKEFNPLVITFFMLGVGFLFFNGAAVITHLYNGTLPHFITPVTNNSFLISIVFLGVLASLVTSLLANFILSKMEASKMSVFSNLSTIVSIGAGAVFLGEVISVYDIIGSLLIIAGVVGTNFFGASGNSTSLKTVKQKIYYEKEKSVRKTI